MQLRGMNRHFLVASHVRSYRYSVSSLSFLCEVLQTAVDMKRGQNETSNYKQFHLVRLR